MYQSQRFRILMYHMPSIYGFHEYSSSPFVSGIFRRNVSRQVFELHPISLRKLNQQITGSGACCLFRLFRWGKLKHDLALFFPGISFFHGTPFFFLGGGSKVDAQMYGSYEGFALDVLFRLVIFKMYCNDRCFCDLFSESWVGCKKQPQ